ncbi:type II toxin-antitoxin system VapC family toxin [Polaromonas jejuensis]|uniref:Ribonuclease VapC n=1 Tax=Polaromonas jejuensis TaxID=457502 RepID=A0ABW0QAI1_9BURK|nr:type II toxin-antitoxin system VapC family toxin [Polaromonas jejuensis]
MRVLFDSSALYKRYNAEAGREQVLAAGARASEVVVAAHCKSEIASALSRQRHEGLVGAQDYARIMQIVQRDFADFTAVPLDGRVEAHSLAAMEASRLPAMDALHIGAAQAARVDLFVTADRRQALAAQAAGLKTELIVEA